MCQFSVLMVEDVTFYIEIILCQRFCYAKFVITVLENSRYKAIGFKTAVTQ